jgi:hypothetical protein
MSKPLSSDTIPRYYRPTERFAASKEGSWRSSSQHDHASNQRRHHRHPKDPQLDAHHPLTSHQRVRSTRALRRTSSRWAWPHRVIPNPRPIPHQPRKQITRIRIHHNPIPHKRRTIHDRLPLLLRALIAVEDVALRAWLDDRLVRDVGDIAGTFGCVARVGGCGDLAGCDVEVEEGALEYLEGSFGLVGGDLGVVSVWNF